MKEKMQNIIKKFLTKEVIMYVIFGVLTTLVNLIISFALVGAFKIGGSIASAIGIVSSILFAYFTNRKWVFNTTAKGFAENLKEFWKFIAGRLVTMVIEQGGVMVLYDVLNMPFVPVKLSLTIIVIILNYIFSKFFAFKTNKEVKESDKPVKVASKFNFLEYIKKNKINIFIFLGMIIFAFIVCSNFLKEHYTNDSYYISAYGYDYYVRHFLLSNRMFSALFLLIFKWLDIPFYKEITIMAVILTFIMVLAWFILYKFVIKLMKKEKSIIYNILIGLASFLVVFNMCTAEGLLYVEVGTMPFGILFAILGACILATDRKFKYVISLILVTMSGLFYQATSAMFVLLALVLIAIKHKGNIKAIIKDTIFIAVIYGIAMIVNFIGVKIWAKILGDEFRKFEMPSIVAILATILKFGETILIDNVGIGPKYFYLALIAILTVIFIIGIILRKKDYFMILEYVTLIILSIIIPIIPILATPATQYIEPRMAMCFGSIIGILIIFLLAVVEIDRNKYLLIAVATITIFNFIINSVFLITASSATLVTNRLDHFIVKDIIQEIEKYETTSGKTIKNVGVAFDKKYTMYYEGEPALRCYNVRSMGTSWAVKEIISTFTGRTFKNTNVPQDVKEKFLQNDWDRYNKEQLVFEEENLYICIY
ncbi:MAG: GtrA family protein [Clostridia bacterium]